jgi:hypothetical protein
MRERMGGGKQFSSPCTTATSTRWRTMMFSLDLFRTTSEGIEWVGTFLDLDAAKAKLTELAETGPGDYSIFDQSTGGRLFYQDLS